MYFRYAISGASSLCSKPRIRVHVGRHATTIVAALLASAFCPTVLADDRLPTAIERSVMETVGFMEAHPDMRFRIQGQKEMEDGRWSEAFASFKRASRYADKVSQAMVAEMLWSGQGMESDRSLAYAWMDLAAERGYEGFVVHRERYWARLDPEERRRAVELGEGLYSEYGDAVARPRLSVVMRRSLLRTMGGRPSLVGRQTAVDARLENGESRSFHLHQYYAPRLWKESEYTRIQDAQWERIPTVNVGNVEQVHEGGSKDD